MNMNITSLIRQLPLFLGMEIKDIEHLRTTRVLKVSRYRKGTLIIKQNSPSEQLYFVIEGTVQLNYSNAIKGYIFTEWTDERKCVLQPECVFGRHPYYAKECKAYNTCTLIEVSKKDVRTILLSMPIFQINYVNHLSTMAQLKYTQLQCTFPHTLLSKFTKEIMRNATAPGGQKLLKIKLKTLAYNLGTTYRNVSHLLHDLEEKDIVNMKRKNIHITSLEKLIAETTDFAV